MTVQVGKGATGSGNVTLDASIFDPVAFHLDDEQAAIIGRARELGQSVFADRAAAYDRDAVFPTENYRDMHRAGLLGIAIPKKHGGLGADYQTYALAAAEIGRYCGATALTWTMHVCSTLWSGPLADDLDMDASVRAEHERRRAIHYKRIVDDGAIYSQPFSEGGAAAAGGVAFGTKAKPRRDATRSTLPSQRRPPESRWSATGIRSACAARFRERCCSRTSLSKRTRH